jgi:ribonuclease E
MSGISKRLPESERTRLKAILKNLIPEEAGVIVRTAAEGVSEEELTNDVARLKAQWEDIYQKSENPNFHAPTLLLSEPDLAVRVIRDIFNEDFRKLTIQGNDAWEEISNYLSGIAPELVGKLEKYSGNGDLFAEFRVEEQLAKAFDRKVYLPSGGSLVIDRTEAMIVIDVNTGKFIGKGGNLEETVTKNNLEAAEEIARQLRLRDLGGIVVIDFIDMVLESNRDAVLRRLVECLGRDRTKHQVAEVTSLGLVQMTRKRVGQGLIEAFSTTCDSCSGRGIHIHMEPVKMKAPMPQVNSQSASHEDVDEEMATEHEFHETLNTESIATDVAPDSEDSAETVAEKPAGRRRRRAASSGIITA